MLLNEGLTPPLRGRPLPVQERKLSQCTHSRTNAAAASLSRPRPPAMAMCNSRAHGTDEEEGQISQCIV